jgi:hypothetical protein
MDITTILIWGHILSYDKVEYYATELTTHDDPHNKTSKWTITAVSKHSTLKLGEVIKPHQEWEHGWIHIAEAIKAGRTPLSAWGRPLEEHLKRIPKPKAAIYWPTHRG